MQRYSTCSRTGVALIAMICMTRHSFFFLQYVSCLFFFFFFQAEDGIRDLIVTGVQTCALPISCARPAASRRCAGNCSARLKESMATSCVIGHSRTLLRWRNDAMATRSHSAAARTRNAAARSARRGRLAPGKQARGLDAAEVAIAIDSPVVAPLVALVRGAGGAA